MTSFSVIEEKIYINNYSRLHPPCRNIPIKAQQLLGCNGRFLLGSFLSYLLTLE